jgi:hypothetical protein
VFLLVAALPHARCFGARTFVALLRVWSLRKKAIAPERDAEGYPIPLGKKSCARLVTYRQCAQEHLEKTSAPLKRKFFMNFFLSSCEEYCSYCHVSIRRADSSSCHPYLESRRLIVRTRKLIVSATIAFDARCARNGACYQLTRCGAHGSFGSTRFENHGRTRRSAAVCASATLSKRRLGCNS